ncbi:MAG TPA: 5'/3'-nucleotidase SurE [Acidimicrobiia bacterium]
MHRLGFLSLLIVPALALGACSSSSSKQGAATTTTKTVAPVAPLRVLVTNDDGVHAPGIDALVQALRALPQITITVVAPAVNQSGTGGKTTKGTLTHSATATASNYPAIAVRGYPADTIVWAIDDHGVAQRPDVVLSGVNNGQNIGPFIKISGTVGAARAAAARGIPALAISAGVGAPTNFAAGAHQAIVWLDAHRAALAAHTVHASVTNINVPTCAHGSTRALVVVPVAPPGVNAGVPVNCVSPAPRPANDVDGFEHGYIVETDDLP